MFNVLLKTPLAGAINSSTLALGMLFGGGILEMSPVEAAQFLSPSAPYLEFADSPFASSSFEYFFLEDFEDGSLNTLGVTASSGSVLGPASLTDSVDGDDGTIDGSGTGGYSYFSAGGGNRSISFTFDPLVLGSLPTDVGIVWTDVGFSDFDMGGVASGEGLVTFEAFDALGTSLGTIGPVPLGDGVFNGTTGEDTFFGVSHSGGISRVTISMNSDDFEIDHLQYGAAVPEPSTILGMAAAAGFGAFFKRQLARKR